MTLGIRYAARSDVGMLREGNEDSAYAGAHLLAVADGMGGHVGGEIASAAAIEALRALDKDLPATELLAALEHTVKTANDNLHRIVESDPALQGMGTTLTAMLWAGNQVALVHIGDSRAYLLRDGSLFQITHDHTLVQSLVDEGGSARTRRRRTRSVRCCCGPWTAAARSTPTCRCARRRSATGTCCARTACRASSPRRRSSRC